ncbi:MAG: hypothetical protein ABJK75_10935 [Tateyamaria sp.]
MQRTGRYNDMIRLHAHFDGMMDVHRSLMRGIDPKITFPSFNSQSNNVHIELCSIGNSLSKSSSRNLGRDMRKIILHIGHGKTGTTATQNLLTVYSAELQEVGITYSVSAKLAELASKGKIQSGNFPYWRVEDFSKLKKYIENTLIDNPNSETLLFSSEIVFSTIADLLPLLHQEYSTEFDFLVVMAVREPLEMLQSHYSQAIKRGGFYGGIMEIAERERHLVTAANIVNVCKRLSVDLKILNYSALGYAINPSLMAAFGVPQSIVKNMHQAERKTANRSLTAQERGMIKSINLFFGAQVGSKCSDALVENLGEIPSEPVETPADAIARVVALNADAADVVNGWLAPNDRLKLQSKADAPSGEHALLCKEQFDSVFEVLGNSLPAAGDQLQHEKEQLQREKEQLQRSLMRAYRYPWKYFRKAWRLRFSKES